MGALSPDVTEPEAWVECQARERENETQIQALCSHISGEGNRPVNQEGELPPAVATDVAVALAQGTLTGILR